MVGRLVPSQPSELAKKLLASYKKKPTRFKVEKFHGPNLYSICSYFFSPGQVQDILNSERFKMASWAQSYGYLTDQANGLTSQHIYLCLGEPPYSA